MQSQKHSFKCKYGHDITIFCLDDKCPQLYLPYCGQQGCTIYKNHSPCIGNVQFRKMYKKLLDKQETLDSSFSFKLFDDISKKVLTLKDSYKSARKQLSPLLTFIQQNRPDKITKKVLKQGREWMDSECQVNIDEAIKALTIQYEKIKTELHEVFIKQKERITGLVQSPVKAMKRADSNSNYVNTSPISQPKSIIVNAGSPLQTLLINTKIFCDELSAKGQFDFNGFKLKKKTPSDGERYFSLIGQCAQRNLDRKEYNFRILNIPKNSSICFGLYHNTDDLISTRKYMEIANQGGYSYTLSTEGKMCSHQFPAQNKTSNKFSFSKDDIVTMFINMLEKKLYFYKNKNFKKEDAVVMNFVTMVGGPLYPCVGMKEQNSEVELIK